MAAAMQQEEIDCSICWSQICGIESIFVHTCRKPFHLGCMDSWLQDKAIEERTCPICRSIISNHEYGQYDASAPFGGLSVVMAVGRLRVVERVLGRYDDRDGRVLPLEINEREILSLLDPDVKFESLSEMQKVELAELKRGRFLGDEQPTGESRFQLQVVSGVASECVVPYAQELGDAIISADPTVEHLEFDMMVAEGKDVEEEMSKVGIWRQVTPELVERFESLEMNGEALAAREALDIAAACYLAAPWYIMELPILGDTINSIFHIIPKTWSPTLTAYTDRDNAQILYHFWNVIQDIGQYGHFFAREIGICIPRRDRNVEMFVRDF